jgi:hypothetical protein
MLLAVSLNDSCSNGAPLALLAGEFCHAEETSDMSQQRQKAGLQLLSSKINERFGITTTTEQLRAHGWLSWQRPGNRNNYFQNEKLGLGPFINSPSVIKAIEAAARLGQKQDVVAMLGHHAVSAVLLSSGFCTSQLCDLAATIILTNAAQPSPNHAISSTIMRQALDDVLMSRMTCCFNVAGGAAPGQPC